ncbi:hypothetical protein D9Q98_002776 [Chlorella vulgaris]|uniref:Uncharacterized protein n=1 Tax=Chlorella vulgaris TaxID=3077 RepID=A0A9D4TVC6_CHLVU|nr:hypothetical protein D9Q98_002776 [Chlorella vulgaris]
MGLVRSIIQQIRAQVKPKPYNAEPQDQAAYGSTPTGAAYSTAPAAAETGGKRRGGAKYKTAFQMVRDPNVRRSRSLNLTHALAYTLIIVGAIFLGLTLGGDYPAPKATLQAAGVYTEYWVKYALYLAGGIGGVAAVLLANRALAAGRSTVLAQIVLLLTVLDVLATIGLTIYLMTLDLGYDWWTILLNVLMLIQRTLYFAVASMALWTLREAHSDETVAAHVAQGQGYAAPAKDEAFMSKV